MVEMISVSCVAAGNKRCKKVSITIFSRFAARIYFPNKFQGIVPFYSQTKWSVALKITLMNELFEYWTR